MRDFNFILSGYYRRLERDKEVGRNIMWFVKHYGGLGNPDKDTPQDIWSLSMDDEDTKKMITSLKMAIEMIKEF